MFSMMGKGITGRIPKDNLILITVHRKGDHTSLYVELPGLQYEFIASVANRVGTFSPRRILSGKAVDALHSLK
jgi:hypothetical protein